MSQNNSYDVLLNGSVFGTLNVGTGGFKADFDFTSPTYDGVMRLVCLSGSACVNIGIPIPEGGVMRLKKSISKNNFEFSGQNIIISGAALIPSDAPVKFPHRDDGEAPVKSDTLPEHHEYLAAPSGDDSEEPMCADAAFENGEYRADVPADDPEDSGSVSSGTDPPEVPVLSRPRPAPYIADKWRDEPDPGRLLASPELRKSLEHISDAKISSSSDLLLALPFSRDGSFPLLPAFRGGTYRIIGGREYIVYHIAGGRVVWPE